MKTQAWGWLIAGVLAAGLNASYHDGSLRWAHEVANRLEHGSAAVLALANGNAERFLSEAQLVADRTETTSCGLSTALARVQNRLVQTRFVQPQPVQPQAVQTGFARNESNISRIDERTAQRELQLARWEANRDRMQARIQAHVDAQMAHIRIQAVAFRPVVVRVPEVPACPRIHLNTIHVNVPRTPSINISVPQIDVESSGVDSSNDPI